MKFTAVKDGKNIYEGDIEALDMPETWDKLVNDESVTITVQATKDLIYEDVGTFARQLHKILNHDGRSVLSFSLHEWLDDVASQREDKGASFYEVNSDSTESGKPEKILYDVVDKYFFNEKEVESGNKNYNVVKTLIRF